MTGFETVLLRVAGTAATTLLKSLLARAPGAGLTADPVRPAGRLRRPTELGDPEIRRLTRTLASRLGEETARLPDHERSAVVDSVADTFAAVGGWTRTPSSPRTCDRRPWRRRSPRRARRA